MTGLDWICYTSLKHWSNLLNIRKTIYSKTGKSYSRLYGKSSRSFHLTWSSPTELDRIEDDTIVLKFLNWFRFPTEFSNYILDLISFVDLLKNWCGPSVLFSTFTLSKIFPVNWSEQDSNRSSCARKAIETIFRPLGNEGGNELVRYSIQVDILSQYLWYKPAPRYGPVSLCISFRSLMWSIHFKCRRLPQSFLKMRD